MGFIPSFAGRHDWNVALFAFVQLFMVPGMQHCPRGGPSIFGGMAAAMNSSQAAGGLCGGSGTLGRYRRCA